MKPSTSLLISIPEPCSQPWEDMTASATGRFCTHCSKTVVDFTGMSDAALLNYIKKNGMGCGRFSDSQLERVIVPAVLPNRKFWPQLFLSLGLFFGILKESAGQETNTDHTVIRMETFAASSDSLSKEPKAITGITPCWYLMCRPGAVSTDNIFVGRGVSCWAHAYCPGLNTSNRVKRNKLQPLYQQQVSPLFQRSRKWRCRYPSCWRRGRRHRIAAV
jgi:hypothetical protein